ncbi:unannotated protein [freshwater metagenome]|uniref:Unannotated protein n=1 Tax=freshwater metagenome TaxID=449393 RepID=A0A6J6NXG7_9ZZZZ|nr:hypothetical protein [Actinomycetota bacterium]MSY52749.1 hypothetical protein [Actinomycetota bacterium]MSY88397.1 hypothetical protein [Actinomycetota bacterium]MTA51269.1 hypothetical protein [Actinomycetota bacterium]
MIVAIRFWEINVLHGISLMATKRRAIRSAPGVTFAKLLGTGRGETFTPRDADSRTWGLLVCLDDEVGLDAFNNSGFIRSWGAPPQFSADLAPIASQGEWAKRQPFIASAPPSAEGRVAAITRARIRPSEALRFWRETPPVTQALKDSAGLLGAIGIGEAPIGLQGTFSLWESGADLRAFAYGSPAHQRAIELTQSRNWYSEELFARFHVLRAEGTLGGRTISAK